MADFHVTATGRRVKHFTLPGGKRIYTTANPSDIDSLRRELDDGSEDSYDIYIHGSPEFLDALRVVEAHHREEHEALKREHSHVLDRYDTVASKLNSLAAELSQATDNRHVGLDANFDRYGYSAHIRVREDHKDKKKTSGPSVQQQQQGLQSSLSQATNPQSARFWKRPVIRQYFHRGLIWRASQREEVAAFELFVDLLYVGIVATIGDAAAEGASGQALLQFVITFFLTWKIWTELVLLVQWFESDDIVQRIFVILWAVLLVGVSTNISDAFDSTYTPLVSFYVAGRLLQMIWIAVVAILNPMFRVSLICIMIGIIVPVALWIGSIHIENPQRLAIIWVAIVLEIFDKASQTFLVTYASKLDNKVLHHCAERAGMTPAINIEHRSERQGAFVTLIFGYMAVNLLFQHSGKSNGVNGFFAKAVMGLITAFCFNSIYFEIDNRNLEVHAIRRSRFSYAFWQGLHLPFVMAFTLASGSLARLVVAHDSPNTNIEQLTEHYASESDGEIKPAHRWFYSAGLGVALACMAAISLTHKHRDNGHQRLPKPYRLALRLAASVVMICLPAAGDRLDSIDIIGIDTALLVLVLAVDYWGSTRKAEPFWFDTSACCYETCDQNGDAHSGVSHEAVMTKDESSTEKVTGSSEKHVI